MTIEHLKEWVCYLKYQKELSEKQAKKKVTK